MPYPYVEEFENRQILDLIGSRRIQTEIMPYCEQEKPFDAKELHTAFRENRKECSKKYFLKREKVTGSVMWFGEDIHGKPSVQLSDSAEGDCYIHCVLARNDYGNLKIGDKVLCEGNFLECHPKFGVVLKMSEITEIYE